MLLRDGDFAITKKLGSGFKRQNYPQHYEKTMRLIRLKLRPWDSHQGSNLEDDHQTTFVNRVLLGGMLWVALSVCAYNAQAISLQEFVTDVVNSNPIVREQVHAYRQVAQDHKIALSGWRPSLDLSSSIGRSSRKAPNTSQRRSQITSLKFGGQRIQTILAITY